MRSLRLALVCAAGLLLPSCSDDTTKPHVDFQVGPPTEGGVVTETGITPGSTTIYDINKEVVKEGATVTLKDVIVTAVDSFGSPAGDVYVQEVKGGAYSGLKLYAPTRTDGAVADLSPGDHVTVTGKIKYFTGTSTSPFDKGHKVIELDKAGTISKLTGGTAPTPADVKIEELADTAAAVNSWMHVLIRVKDVPVTKPLDTKYNEFQVGTIGLAVDDEMFLPNPAPKLGDCLTLTGVFMYFYDYKLAPRAQQDFGTGTGCPAPKTVTVKDIQDETSANHPAVKSPVTVTGVVTAIDKVPYGTSNEFQGFYMQDPAGGVRSGIYVYYKWSATTPAANKPVEGNTVEVSGTYDEYKPDATKPETLSEITTPTVTDKGAGTMPAPAVVNAADIATGGAKTEDYEGVLVKVEGSLKVASIVSTTGTTPKPIGFKLETSNLNVENELFDFMATGAPTVGATYTSITGPLAYSYGNFKIVPRSAADLAK